MSSISSKDYVPSLLKSASLLVNSSNSIPTGEDFSFLMLDKDFSLLTTQIQEKLESLLLTLTQFITPETTTIEYEDVVEAGDKCLEQVAITLDNMKNPSKSIAKISNYDLPKPNLPLKTNNSFEAFVPILTHKPNSCLPLELSPGQPYLPELEKLKCSPEQFSVTDLMPFKELEETELVYVDNLEKLKEMASVLKKSSEIAVDLEHHSFRSYLGFTCLIQISTRDQDFIVDPFPVWGDLHLLLDTFTDPNIVKVLHGADSDILWLQRDFGIYVVNMFDTGQAARKLMFNRFGLGFLLENICNVQTNKNFQLADWRIRPLSEDHLKYARIDTHYLLHIYDYLKIQLQQKASQLKLHPFEYIRDVFDKSKEICMKKYEKPDLSLVGITGIEILEKKQKKVLEKLVNWRDKTARDEDENPNYILSARKMMMIVFDRPNNSKELAKIVQNVNFLKKYSEKVLEVINNVDFSEQVQSDKFENLKTINEVPQIKQVSYNYVQKFKVTFKAKQQISYFHSSNFVVREKHAEKIKKIEDSLKNIFSAEKAQFFNTKSISKARETLTKKVEPAIEEFPLSVQEKYNIPFKNKMPQTRKIKQNIVKKQKISEKKDIKIGWLDNVELMPVKRKNLFKKKHN